MSFHQLTTALFTRLKIKSARTLILSVFSLVIHCTSVFADAGIQQLSDAYVARWIEFYPSEAFTNGHAEAAWQFENFSDARVADWLAYNREVAAKLESIDKKLSIQEEIDSRVLLRQSLLELEAWQHDRVLHNQAIFYAELISQALTYVLVRDQFTAEEKVGILLTRLRGIQSLSEQGQAKLENGSPQRTQRAVNILEQTLSFYESGLPVVAAEWLSGKANPGLEREIQNTVKAVEALIAHINKQVLPTASIPDKFTNEDYTRKLRVHLEPDLVPEKLEQIAITEIEKVRRMMASLAKSWWVEEYPDKAVPVEDKLLQLAMDAMESDRADNRQDFLDFFVKLTREAEAFVIENEIATVPQPTTLKVALSPDHFSGAAYGGVYPTGPFNPNADTLFYLPSIPDSSSADQKSGFYRSFNTHFNTMIIAHEMLPGHYLQYKVGVSTAPALRSLFANGVYVEGWGTFSEELMLDAGWGNDLKLTRLAHLRKRLENATRAYVSVMVHYRGWDKDQLIEFATDRGLLAPQFAINLWNRVMNSPLQIPSYFLGFHAFRELWQEQKVSLGQRFTTREFVDTVLRAGPIPIDALAESMLGVPEIAASAD